MTLAPQSQTLEQVLSGIAGEPLLILITGHPDPDAIGSALAHQRICEHLGVPATIAHVLGVSHHQNRALLKLLNVDMLQVSSAAELARFRYLSLVDTSTPEPTIELPADLKLLTVVDHHRAAKVDAPFVDIRPAMGASCSIYAEYLQHGLTPLTKDRREDSRVATALLFGIQTDTDDFSLATEADFLAAAYVKPFCEADVLKRIGRRAVSASAMSVLARALSDLYVVRDFALAGVGVVAAGDRDTIGTAADFILRREDIDTVLVYGIVQDRVDGSLRTNSSSVDPAAFLLGAFGRDPAGKPYGGGRADKGGFQVPLGMLAEVEDRDALWVLTQQLVKTRLLRVVPDLDQERAPRRSGRTRFPPDEE
jgi:nanoRNase/pAp phosphatase (c-di-AMP/oligoRNAs hydrolase)